MEFWTSWNSPSEEFLRTSYQFLDTLIYCLMSLPIKHLHYCPPLFLSVFSSIHVKRVELCLKSYPKEKQIRLRKCQRGKENSQESTYITSREENKHSGSQAFHTPCCTVFSPFWNRLENGRMDKETVPSQDHSLWSPTPKSKQRWKPKDLFVTHRPALDWWEAIYSLYATWCEYSRVWL